MNSSVTIRLVAPGIAAEQADRHPSPSQTHAVECVVSDESLMAEVCIGSREALAVLFRRYAGVVRGVAYRVLRDASEADDLLQDTW